MNEPKPGLVILKEVRLSFPHLWEPTASVEGGKPKFRASFLIDPKTGTGKDNVKKIEAAIKAAELEVFKKSPMAYKNPDRRCLKDGNTQTNQKTGEIYDGYENMMVISASNGKRSFSVVDRDRTTLTEKDTRPYAGCYVNAVVRIWATKDPKLGGNGVFASLEGVQFLKDGEPFGAAPVDPNDVFADESGSTDDDEEL